jgi:hypothetical protein
VPIGPPTWQCAKIDEMGWGDWCNGPLTGGAEQCLGREGLVGEPTASTSRALQTKMASMTRDIEVSTAG